MTLVDDDRFTVGESFTERLETYLVDQSGMATHERLELDVD